MTKPWVGLDKREQRSRNRFHRDNFLFEPETSPAPAVAPETFAYLELLPAWSEGVVPEVTKAGEERLGTFRRRSARAPSSPRPPLRSNPADRDPDVDGSRPARPFEDFLVAEGSFKAPAFEA